MKIINLFYFSVLVVGGVLFFILRPEDKNKLSFYGFAESNETEINYNYPVVVDKILVQPGQFVQSGDLLMQISRRKSKEVLEDQNFKIEQLKAEEIIWNQKKQNEIKESELTYENKISELDSKISMAKKELEYKKSLSENLQSISPSPSNYKPDELKIEKLLEDKLLLQKTHLLKIDGIQDELRLGINPYRVQINRLKAELEFEDEQKIQFIDVTAPTDGLIGNISCKEEEHIPSYNTLLSFYEPHSVMIKGYVHEDLTLEVHVGDEFLVSSLKDSKISYTGQVTGLGSRIVEIPARLRKIPAITSFGREVLIEIPVENSFLQKEKVSISHIIRKD